MAQKIEKLRDMKVSPALCLDLDGTVRRSKSGATFIKGPRDIELMPGIEQVIMHFSERDYLIIGISNQGGVAHGYKLPGEISMELSAMFSLFKKNPFHLVKCCFHDSKGTIEPYNHRSLGDRPEDMECAASAQIDFMHIDEFLKYPV